MAAVAPLVERRAVCSTCGRLVAVYVIGGTAVPHRRPGHWDAVGKRPAQCPDRAVYRHGQ